MKLQSANGIAFYTFDSLANEPGVVHAISTRQGGVSPAPYDTLNLSISTGDAPANVTANTERFHAALGLDAASSVDASQAQGEQVSIVGKAQKGSRISHVDALLTQETNVPLLLRFADCVPILLFDPVQRAIGVVHAGWRGTVAKIGAKSVRTMEEAFGSQASDIIACIGPSIGSCCYQVGDDVADLVRRDLDDPESVLVRHNGSTHFDLWRANVHLLESVGVERIEIARICTADRTDEFYSWRAENKKTGRFGALIALSA